MREIKFRFWFVEKEEMSKPYAFAELVADGWYDIPTYIPMQFTGLKDKNGKEIYVGDIVRRTWYQGGAKKPYGKLVTTSIIEWCEKYGYLKPTAIFQKRKEMEYSMVGNIYENKNLLK